MQPEQQQRIMGYFIEEAKDHLNTIEQGLLNLQSTIDDPDLVNEVFRAAHSVKGGAAMLGLTSIQKTSHRLEDYFKILKETPGVKPDQKIESLLLQVFDTLQELLDHLQSPNGLDEETSDAAIANIDPVFQELSQHFMMLEHQASQAQAEKGTVIQGAAVEDTALTMIFQNDVPTQLREMLQLFRQAEASADGRDRLLELCQALKGLGDALSLKAWSGLLETTEKAIANPNNAYRTLAPIVITELKQAQNLVLAGRAKEIQASEQLQSLATPTAPAIDSDLADFFAVADGAQSTDELDLGGFDFAATESTELDLSGFDLPTSDSEALDLGDFDLAVTPAAEGQADLELDGMFDLPEATSEVGGLDDLFSDRNGPEVGMEELNSLADLFEGEMPDLGSNWQAEEVISAETAATQNGAISLDEAGDFSDLLGASESSAPAAGEDDLTSLFGNDLLEAFDAPGAEQSSDDFEIPDFDAISDSPSELSPAPVAEESDFADLNLDDFDGLGSDLAALNEPLAEPDTEDAESFDNLGELFAGLDEGELSFDAAPELNTAISTNGEADLSGLDLNGILESNSAESSESLDLIGSDDTSLDLSALDAMAESSDLDLGDDLGDLDELSLESQAESQSFNLESLADPWGEPESPALADGELDFSAEVSDLLSDLDAELDFPVASDAEELDLNDLGLDPALNLDALVTDTNYSEAETLELVSSDRQSPESLDDLLGDDLLGSLTEDASEDLELNDLIGSSETSYEAAGNGLDLSDASDISVDAALDDLLDFSDTSAETVELGLDTSAEDLDGLFEGSDDLNLDLGDAEPLFGSEEAVEDSAIPDSINTEVSEVEELLGLDDLLGVEAGTGDLDLGLDETLAATAEVSESAGSFDELDGLFDSEEAVGPELGLEEASIASAEISGLDDLGLNFDEITSEAASDDGLADLDLELGAIAEEGLGDLDLGETAAEDLSGDLFASEEISGLDDLDLNFGEAASEAGLGDLELGAIASGAPSEDLSLDLGETASEEIAGLDDLDLNFGEAASEADLGDLDLDLGAIAAGTDDGLADLDLDLGETASDLDELDLNFDATPVEASSEEGLGDLDLDLGETASEEIAGLDDLDLNFDDVESDDLLSGLDATVIQEDVSAELPDLADEFSLDTASEANLAAEDDLLLGLDLASEETDSTADLALNFDDLETSNGAGELGDLDDLLNVGEDETHNGNGFNAMGAAGIAAASIAGLGAAFAANQSKEDDDLAALLGDGDSAELGDLDGLLDSSNEVGVENGFFATQAEDSFADLDGLLDADDNLASSDEFGDLDALLEDAPATNGAASATEDFSDLESLLADAPDAVVPQNNFVASNSEPDAEFDDLEKMLEDADKTMGSTPTAKSRNAAAPARRSTRPSKGFSEQTMRVPVKHLDNLSNLVGELVVNRNSLEQDQERLRQSLDNLLYQVQQLSDVGQRMQDLYERSLLESSLLASRQNHRVPFGAIDRTSNETSPTGVEYDPLEMDRFTGFHSLSQEMIELIVRVRESSSDIEFIVDETEQVTRMFRQVTTQLQEGLTRSRMVPFAQTADRLPRAVRDIALKCGRQAELVIEGRDTLIDKMILEHLYDPMTHLVNNAITHGIEAPETRVGAGKAPTGQITIRAFHQGNQTVISVGDDGAGIDVERVRIKAIEKGLITSSEAQSLSRLDIYDFLFHPGFSTKDQADDFSGRGVGMDVVRTSLSEIRGTVTIDSVQGKGTTFTIRLPLTLSISKALCCISDRARIAFPMDGVEDMLDLPKERIQTNAEGQPIITWRDTVLPVRPLNDLLSLNRHLSRGNVYGTNQEDDIVSVVVLRSAGNYLALQVDQVLGEQEIVIKQLEGPVPKPIGIAGATVLGDGRIMPIADVLELIDLSMGRIRREVGTMWEQGTGQATTETVTAKTEPMVLIVDDSITVRELLSMTFNKVGYRVEQARDGQEAWEKLRAGLPCDIVFCDIEMPRMDGLELLSRIQKDPNLSQLPIAMLTSRGADRHRQMAASLGASGYFTKPYLEEALLDAAQRMLKGEVLMHSAKDTH